MKILIIEDEHQLRRSIQESLELERFLVEFASDYKIALEKILLYDYDCILLDVVLPQGSGLELLKKLKKEGKGSNVIIISAKDSIDDKLTGLELGADDYLTKPFHLAELSARVKAVLRRKQQEGSKTVCFSNLKLELDRRELLVDRSIVPLNRKEFDILYYFLQNKCRLVTKVAIAEHVWGDHVGEAQDLDFVYYQIKNLRKKLQESNAQVVLSSVHGIGYKIIEK